MWIWQQPKWPQFSFNPSILNCLEQKFLLQRGRYHGSLQHLPSEDQLALSVQLLSLEGEKNAAIEGEILERSSVQISIQKNLGIQIRDQRVGAREQGMAELLAGLYRDHAVPLTEELLHSFHRSVMKGSGLAQTGAYRTFSEPMQIISGPHYAPKVHYEAPPSVQVGDEMRRFLRWYKESAQTDAALVRAGIAHIYFEWIHPYEDGNGRIGRALAEKVLSEALQQPSLTCLSIVLEKRRKDYYQQLERAGHSLELTSWLLWFAERILEAGELTQRWISFTIEKNRLLNRLKDQLNPRQEKVLHRLAEAGPEGFSGGLSAANYRAITKASTATTTRDLADLVTKKALVRVGERKHARYHLPCRTSGG